MQRITGELEAAFGEEGFDDRRQQRIQRIGVVAFVRVTGMFGHVGQTTGPAAGREALPERLRQRIRFTRFR
ncbi:MAG: hypothetical protein QM599_09270 [Pseudoxanthomonas sp.]